MSECNCLRWWLAILALVIGFIYWRTKEAFKFWQSRNIPHQSPSFPFGNFGKVFFGKASIGMAVEEIYNKFKGKGPYAGYFTLLSPTLVVLDPEAIKNIMVKDFQYFHNRGEYYNEKDDPLSAHLFSIEDEKWKRLRKKLSPTFTSGKMKMMYSTMMENVNELKEYMQETVAEKSTFEIKDVLARFTTDVIGSCALGIQCNTLKNPDAEFREIGRKVFQNNIFSIVKQLFAFTYKSLSRRLGITVIDKEVTKFFLDRIDETIQFREKNNVKCNDFLQLLIQLKTKGYLEDNEGEVIEDKSALTLNEIAAQAFVFYLGGFETSSTTMSFCLYELAVNPDIQKKCRDEINRILDENDGKLSYDCILQMNYLDKVIYETMRKYPTLPVLTRECSKDYTLPGTTFWIPKGTSVFIPVIGLHKDPEIYPDPEKFDPERFSEEAKNSRHQYTYLPFGEGPRICIGMRFGMMQTRLGLITIIRDYNILPSNETKIPLELDTRSFLTAAVGGITLKFESL